MTTDKPIVTRPNVPPEDAHLYPYTLMTPQNVHAMLDVLVARQERNSRREAKEQTCAT